MAGLNGIGVPTHFIRRINMREQLVRMAEIVPLEMVVRNFAAGDMSTRLGIPEGTPLPRPIVEYYFKDDKLGTPLVGRRAYRRLRLGQPAGSGRHHRAGPAGERFPVGRDDGRRASGWPISGWKWAGSGRAISCA